MRYIKYKFLIVHEVLTEHNHSALFTERQRLIQQCQCELWGNVSIDSVEERVGSVATAVISPSVGAGHRARSWARTRRVFYGEGSAAPPLNAPGITLEAETSSPRGEVYFSVVYRPPSPTQLWKQRIHEFRI